MAESRPITDPELLACFGPEPEEPLASMEEVSAPLTDSFQTTESSVTTPVGVQVSMAGLWNNPVVDLINWFVAFNLYDEGTQATEKLLEIRQDSSVANTANSVTWGGITVAYLLTLSEGARNMVSQIPRVGGYLGTAGTWLAEFPALALMAKIYLIRFVANFSAEKINDGNIPLISIPWICEETGQVGPKATGVCNNDPLSPALDEVFLAKDIAFYRRLPWHHQINPLVPLMAGSEVVVYYGLSPWSDLIHKRFRYEDYRYLRMADNLVRIGTHLMTRILDQAQGGFLSDPERPSPFGTYRRITEQELANDSPDGLVRGVAFSSLMGIPEEKLEEMVMNDPWIKDQLYNILKQPNPCEDGDSCSSARDLYADLAQVFMIDPKTQKIKIRDRSRLVDWLLALPVIPTKSMTVQREDLSNAGLTLNSDSKDNLRNPLTVTPEIAQIDPEKYKPGHSLSFGEIRQLAVWADKQLGLDPQMADPDRNRWESKAIRHIVRIVQTLRPFYDASAQAPVDPQTKAAIAVSQVDPLGLLSIPPPLEILARRVERFAQTVLKSPKNWEGLYPIYTTGVRSPIGWAAEDPVLGPKDFEIHLLDGNERLSLFTEAEPFLGNLYIAEPLFGGERKRPNFMRDELLSASDQISQTVDRSAQNQLKELMQRIVIQAQINREAGYDFLEDEPLLYEAFSQIVSRGNGTGTEEPGTVWQSIHRLYRYAQERKLTIDPLLQSFVERYEREVSAAGLAQAYEAVARSTEFEKVFEEFLLWAPIPTHHPDGAGQTTHGELLLDELAHFPKGTEMSLEGPQPQELGTLQALSLMATSAVVAYQREEGLTVRPERLAQLEQLKENYRQDRWLRSPGISAEKQIGQIESDAKTFIKKIRQELKGVEASLKSRLEQFSVEYREALSQEAFDEENPFHRFEDWQRAHDQPPFNQEKFYAFPVAEQVGQFLAFQDFVTNNISPSQLDAPTVSLCERFESLRKTMLLLSGK